MTSVTLRTGSTPAHRSRILVQIWIRCGYVSPQNFQADVTVIKGKAIPVQGWTGPEGSRSLRLLDFLTVGT